VLRGELHEYMIEHINKYETGGGDDCQVSSMIISQVLGAEEYCFTIPLTVQVWVRKHDKSSTRHNKQKWTMALDGLPRHLQERHGDALLQRSTPVHMLQRGPPLKRLCCL
jgi:hypothetical protein